MTAYRRLADLPLTITAYDFQGVEQRVSSDFLRRTTLVELQGGEARGVGEDVTYEEQDQLKLQRHGPRWPLAGSHTLDGFSRLLDELDLFPDEPRSAASRFYRRWAFESAALDLALHQAGRSLAGQLDLEPRPVRFVVSLRLGKPPSAEPVRRLLQRHPGLQFKLDATSDWSPQLIADLVATGAVVAIDFKGAYRGTIVDQPPDPELYGRVAESFPEACLEDPALVAATDAVLADHRERISWDAPIHSMDDVRALPFPPRLLNIKPSRFGSLRSLFEAYAYCEDRGITVYGGGQFELGPGRGQIQYLASLFHPASHNDVAPQGYNLADPQPGLPSSPLAPSPGATGFRWG